MIAVKLRQRIQQLENRHASIREPMKPMLPGWLLEMFVLQGARLDGNGELDLASVAELQRKQAGL